MENAPASNSDETLPKVYLVKPSLSAFLIRLGGVTLITWSGVILGYFLFMSLFPDSSTALKLFLIIVISLILIEGVIFLYSYVWMLNLKYFIKFDSVQEDKGIFQIREKITAIKDIENIRLRKPLLGRFFNYGTVIIKKLSLTELYYLNDVHNPQFVFDRLYENWRTLLDKPPPSPKDIPEDKYDEAKTMQVTEKKNSKTSLKSEPTPIPV